MVKITNGNREIEVTKGAFKEIYSRQGYVLASEYTEKKNNEPFYKDYPDIVGSEKKQTRKQYQDDPTLPEYDDDKDVMIPLSEMTVDELKAYAKANNIQLDAGMKKKAIIDAIMDVTTR